MFIYFVQYPLHQPRPDDSTRQYLQKLGSQLTEELDDMSDVNWKYRFNTPKGTNIDLFLPFLIVIGPK